MSDERYDQVEKLEALGQRISHSVLDIAIGWLAAKPYVASVIAGVTKPEQIKQNVCRGKLVAGCRRDRGD